MKKISLRVGMIILSIVVLAACKSGRRGGGVRSNFCFTGDTKIAVQSGTTEISRLHTGDLVLSYNASTGSIETAAVLEMKSVKHDNLYKMSFETAQVKMTDDHPVWVKGKGWASLNPKRTMEYMKLEKVSQLEAGDVCLFLSANGKTAESRLLKTEAMKGVYETYTITKLSRNMHFFANGIVVGVEELKANPL